MQAYSARKFFFWVDLLLCCLFRGGYDFFEFLKFSLLLLMDDAMMFAFED